jgi:nicotinamidase-related amidase
MQRLKPDDAALLVIDVQERLCAAMDPRALERMLRRTVAAIKGAQAIGLPVIFTEQYPKGLGGTVADIQALMKTKPVEKMQFSCALPQVVEAIGKRSQILVAGMEAHVCVYQTVRDLADRRFTPYVLVDAILSRTSEDRQVGLELCRGAGAVVTTVEAALFDLLGRADTPEFKAVSQAVK